MRKRQDDAIKKKSFQKMMILRNSIILLVICLRVLFIFIDISFMYIDEALILIMIIFIFWDINFWNCPYCRGYIGIHRFMPKKCKHCESLLR